MRKNDERRKKRKRSGSKRNGGNRKYKDSVFRLLYRGKRELLDLYNAVNGTDHSNPEELETAFLGRDEMLLRVRNDVSCIINFRLNLYEHQSTYNPNIPVRLLLYVSNAYYEWMDRKGADMYSKKRIRIPTPRFFVFYNGLEERPDVERLLLSDLYYQKDSEPALELVVIQYNINAGHNPELLKKCETLRGYTIFVEKVRKNQENGMPVEEAVKEAADACIRENILKGFFQKRYKEVIKMRTAEYWIRRHEKALVEEGREEGIQEGIQKGIQKGMQALIITCKEWDLSYEEILGKIKTAFDLDDVSAKENLDRYW